MTTTGRFFMVAYVLVGGGTLVAFVSALDAHTLARQAEYRQARCDADRQ